MLVSSDVSGLVEANNQSGNASISSNGRYVVFESMATDLDAVILSPGTTQIYLKDMQTGSVVLVSRSAALKPDNSFNSAKNASVSDDGQFVVFESAATNLHAVILSGGIPQIYRKNTINEAVEMISRSSGNPGNAGNGDSTNPAISADGTHIVFESIATNLNTSSGFKHIYYVNNNMAHAVETISVTTAGLDANAGS